MVEFSVFNELSLPLKNRNSFNDFFEVLEELNNKGLKTIRMDREFKEYPEILPNISLQKFFGTLDKDERTKLRTFMSNGISIIESPLIKDEEIEDNEDAIENEYFYNAKSNFGGLACADIWNTISVSFNSDIWDKNSIVLQKNEEDIEVRHSSKIEHLDSHKIFFKDLENDKRLGITQDNFWEKREEFFPNRIIFCKEVKKQIKNIDKRIFQHAIGILNGIEKGNRPITKLLISNEGDTVSDNTFFRSKREFTLLGKKEFFEKHIKNFPNDKHRIHFLEKGNKIYIGYIGKHLPTKKDRT